MYYPEERPWKIWESFPQMDNILEKGSHSPTEKLRRKERSVFIDGKSFAEKKGVYSSMGKAPPRRKERIHRWEKLRRKERGVFIDGKSFAEKKGAYSSVGMQ